MFTEQDAKEAILRIAELKGIERAKIIERMARWETGHFKSKQYKLTGSFGMEAGKWAGLDSSKFKTIDMLDNHPDKVKKPMRKFLVWESVFDFCLYLSDYIDRHQGNYARWNSTLQSQQKQYKRAVDSVTTKFV